MKIAIVGAGFTGLTAGYTLARRKHHIVIFEKEPALGGLAGTFKQPSWEWEIEKHYHHWFTNDSAAINLIRELGLGNHLLFPKTRTAIYYQNKIFPFNSARDVLNFNPLSLPQRLQSGLVTLYLKLLPKEAALSLERFTARDWLQRHYGTTPFRILWEPLLNGKFSDYAQTVNMAWFWARIKKRTPLLGYLAGGYHRLLVEMASRIEANGGTIHLNKPFDSSWAKKFDAIIVTTPSKIFTQLFTELPSAYTQQLTTIPHLHALNLLLITKKPFLNDVYWLNVNDRSYPFIAVVQHTNMVNKKHYGGNHITWVGNYLPPNHPYLKMSKEKLFKVFLPYLKKINPSFNFELLTLNFELFMGPFAQPVFPVNYSRIKPNFVTPIKNVFLANMDMVYPWDRGTNYAIELGYEVAEMVEKNNPINQYSTNNPINRKKW